MEPKRVITASQAAALVPSNRTITTGGFGSCGHPDLLTEALAARFIATAQPTDLTLVFAAGQGDKASRGLNRLAIKGLLKKVVGVLTRAATPVKPTVWLAAENVFP